MSRLIIVLCVALVAVANAGCTDMCTKSSTDTDFVKEYIAKAEAAAVNLGSKIEAVATAENKQSAASATQVKASAKAEASKKAYEKSGLLGSGFWRGDSTINNLNQLSHTAAKGAHASAKMATENASGALRGAETDMAQANQSIRNAAKFAISGCINACRAARDAAKATYAAHPSNKFGVSMGLSLAAGGKPEQPAPAPAALTAAAPAALTPAA